MLEKIAKWLTRKPKLVAMMAVLMLIPAAIGYISPRINYDILSYLPEDLESSHGEKLLEEPFKMAATSMLVVESMPAGYTNSLLNDIKAIDGVSNAIWISNLMGIQIPTDMIPANFRDMFFAGDATMMIIQYDHPGASDETMEAIEQVRKACNEKCFLAGFSVVIKDTRDLMDSELPIFVGLAVLLALCILNAAALTRRTNRWMDQADRIAQLAEQERWDMAREAMDALSADWESAQDFLHVVIHHETLDAAQVTLTRCRTLCRLRQGDDLLPELAQLRQQLQQLDELERLSLRNIL